MRLGGLHGFEDFVDVNVPQHVKQHAACDGDDRDADQNTKLVQDLLLAQKRYRPAYGFQHLDLEYASATGDGRVNLGAAIAAPSSDQAVVARFAQKLNSVGANKTRSFNILDHVRPPARQLDAFLGITTALPRQCTPRHEVFVTLDLERG
jgi:hypothetical protein